MIFLEPMTSLNPVFTVGAQIAEAIILHQNVSADQAMKDAVALLDRVGIPSPDARARDYPHQLSGGMRQRISIARALTAIPKLLVCDEPVSALDVAIQAQILNLLARLKSELSLSYLFISHDLGVVRHVCDDVAVMYLGQIVEQAPVEPLFDAPQHPYTQALLAAAPSPARRKSKGYTRLMQIKGDPSSPINPPAGCAFAARCPRAQAKCTDQRPILENHIGHGVACFFPGPSTV